MGGLKTAVVVLHGMGEQRPMDTLPGFVDAVWVQDKSVVSDDRNAVFSKPDSVSGSFELRRMTTLSPFAGRRKRVDFFEFYYAHHMQGHKMGAVWAWLKRLFWRRPNEVPAELMGMWRLGVGTALVTLVLLVLWKAPALGLADQLPSWLAAGIGAAVALFGLVFPPLVLPRIGDAARYLDAAPGNVAMRNKVRAEGVELLKALAKRKKYDRIIIAAHSLGAAVAYDMVTFLWAQIDDAQTKTHHAPGSEALEAMEALETAGLALRDAAPNRVGTLRIAYREAQRRYFKTLSQGDNPLWLISDLVTMGAPLSKADVLLTRTPKEFAARKARRELPTCPPVYETERGGAERFSYIDEGNRRPHHAAPFAPVVWTNIYHPHWRIIMGDVVSGPVAPKFGRGIVDVELRVGTPPGFRHNNYWVAKTVSTRAETLAALRKAVNLLDKDDECEIWGDVAESTPIRGLDLV